MDISLATKYVTHSIDGMLASQCAVEVAKKLVQPGSDIKPGLKKLAKAGALHLSFESMMLEKQFRSLFSKQVLEMARFNLLEADPTYQPTALYTSWRRRWQSHVNRGFSLQLER